MDSGKSNHNYIDSPSTEFTEPEYPDLNSDPDSFTSLDGAIPNLNLPIPSSPLYFTDISMFQSNSQERLLPDIDVSDYFGPQFDGSEVQFRSFDQNPTLNDEQNSIRVSNAGTHANSVQNSQSDRSYSAVGNNAFESVQMSRQNPGGFDFDLTENFTHHGSSTPAVMNSNYPGNFSSTAGNIAAMPDLNLSQQADWNTHFDFSQKPDGNFFGPTNMAHGPFSPVQNVGGNHASNLTPWPSCTNFQALPDTNNMLNPRLSHLSPMQQFGTSPLSNSHLSRGFQSYRPIPPAAFCGNQVRTPNSGQLGFQQGPLHNPFTAGNNMETISAQPQGSYARPVANLNSNSQPTAVHPSGVCNTKQDQSDHSIPVTQGSSSQVTRQFLNIGTQPAGNLNQPQTVVHGLQASKAPPLQPTGNLNQPQMVVHGLQASKAPPLQPTGPPTPVENVSGPSQATSSRRIRVSRKRVAPQATVEPPKIQQRNIRPRVSNTPAVRPQLIHSLPSVRPITPLHRQPTAFRNSLRPLGTTGPLAHIKRTVPCPTPEPEPEQNEEKCFLCKRNVRYAPKGPYVKPTNPLPVAVLPCGHVFHDECLEDITPKTDAKNPPCIPCVMGGN